MHPKINKIITASIINTVCLEKGARDLNDVNVSINQKKNINLNVVLVRLLYHYIDLVLLNI